MPEIHLSIFVIEDCILYNLVDLKWDVLDDGIIEQGPCGHHFTHIGHLDKTGCDEVIVTPQKYPRIFIIKLLYIPGIN